MKGIGTGFTLLKQGKYLEALNRFKEGLAKARDPNVIKTCLYGKARAQIGLNNISVAIQLLEKLIEEHPKWEVPYRALTRIYENRNNIKEAEALYLKAINSGCRSKQMCKQYEWFLLNFIPPVQAIYAPGFGAQRLQQQFIAARAIGVDQEPGLRFGYR